MFRVLRCSVLFTVALGLDTHFRDGFEVMPDGELMRLAKVESGDAGGYSYDYSYEYDYYGDYDNSLGATDPNPELEITVEGQTQTVYLVPLQNGTIPTVVGKNKIKVPFDTRFALALNPEGGPSPNASDYFYFQLIGKTLSFTVDLHGKVGCGCNAAIYSVEMPSMKQSTKNNWYCDANTIEGQSCPEMDFHEGNLHRVTTNVHGCNKPWTDLNCDKWGTTVAFQGDEFDNKTGSTIHTGEAYTMSLTFTESVVTTALKQGSKLVSKSNTHLANGFGGPGSMNGPNNGIVKSLSDPGHVMVISFWGDKNMAWLDEKSGCKYTGEGKQKHIVDTSPPNYGTKAVPHCGEFYTLSNIEVKAASGDAKAKAKSAAKSAAYADSHGCCGWGGGCGTSCGEDGSGWCHQTDANCVECGGTYDEKAIRPSCN